DITVKRSFYKEKEVSCKPEYDECRKIAAEKGIPVKEIYNNVMALIVHKEKVKSQKSKVKSQKKKKNPDKKNYECKRS
ncbi:MAG: DUF111 family protein, partial [Bacteroidales bacterium]|nr:DUF111 family protein [Bacteroidales bacterium]